MKTEYEALEAACVSARGARREAARKAWAAERDAREAMVVCVSLDPKFYKDDVESLNSADRVFPS